MRVTSKGQVTIPRNVREALGITPETEVDFVREDDKFYIVKTDRPTVKGKLRKLRGIASASMSTDEIMGLTRDAE
ncbi:AbrB/MazE/SpoVT family DNA-binding domain-containing protein [Thiolapillus sp.]|uniref:AbrB/MazE/SpoVT family DNA-binding domain-containing protein n=1 Tax=Thiolapillus sp. TaxID=2017437 RepID=UPI0025E02C32|nr:AbrB/MazE/SpoVT family DNA-binding domain-containing protein [Thiolapillus sp.]